MKKILLGIVVLSNLLLAQNYGVGMKHFKFADNTREELLTDISGDFRDVIFKVWYPTEENSKAQKLPILYGDETLKNAVNLEYLPFITDERFKTTLSDAVLNASIISSKSKFPLIIYNHGGGMIMEDNVRLIESLVKKGYVVMSVGHKYLTSQITDVNNKVVTDVENTSKDINFSNMADGFSWEKYDEMDAVLKNTKVIDKTYVENFYKQYDGFIGTNKIAKLIAEDSLVALNKLDVINKSEFKDLIDTSRYATLGYSIGGAAGAYLMNRDAKCVGALNLDGTNYGVYRDKDFKKPYLQLLSSYFIAREDSRYIKSIAKDTFNFITFKNTNHANFSIFTEMVPEFKTMESWVAGNFPTPTLGPIDAVYFNNKVAEISYNFMDSIFGKNDFKKYLKTIENDENLFVNKYVQTVVQ